MDWKFYIVNPKEKALKLCIGGLDQGIGDGWGDGYGNGGGYCDGDGDGDGDGYGYGDGWGNGKSSTHWGKQMGWKMYINHPKDEDLNIGRGGLDRKTGDGYGFGNGDGEGYGYGWNDGSGYGDGWKYGNGYGISQGNGGSSISWEAQMDWKMYIDSPKDHALNLCHGHLEQGGGLGDGYSKNFGNNFGNNYGYGLIKPKDAGNGNGSGTSFDNGDGWGSNYIIGGSDGNGRSSTSWG